LRADDQQGHSGDSDAFDIVPGPQLGLWLPLAGDESSAGWFGQGTLTLPRPLATNLQVMLTSSLPHEINVPASLLVPAGQTNGYFNVVNYDDALLDGTRYVNITASAPGFASATAQIANYDDETAILSVTVPETITEGN